jgi:hypothetical protein
MDSLKNRMCNVNFLHVGLSLVVAFVFRLGSQFDLFFRLYYAFRSFEDSAY